MMVLRSVTGGGARRAVGVSGHLVSESTRGRADLGNDSTEVLCPRQAPLGPDRDLSRRVDWVDGRRGDSASVCPAGFPFPAFRSRSIESVVVGWLMLRSLTLVRSADTGELTIFGSTDRSSRGAVVVGEIDISVGIGIDVSTAGAPKLKPAKLPSKPSVCRLFLISAFSFSDLSFTGLLVTPSSMFLLKLRRLGEWKVMVSRLAITFRTTGPSGRSSLTGGLGSRVCSAVLTLRRELGAGGLELCESFGSVCTLVKPCSTLATEGGGEGYPLGPILFPI